MAPNRSKKRKVADGLSTVKKETNAGPSTRSKKETEVDPFTDIKTEREEYDGEYENESPGEPVTPTHEEPIESSAKPTKQDNANPRSAKINPRSPKKAPSPAPNSAAQAGNRSQQRRKIANFFASIWQDDSDNEDDFESDDDKSVAEDGHSWADGLGDDEYCEDFINQRKCGIHIRFDLGLMGLPVEWAEKITVSCTVDGKPVGHGLGRYIKRSLITQDSWERMTQGEDPGLSTLALELFDRYGRLTSELKSHHVRKGTGVWGPELDSGDLFLIDHICVEDGWRQQGVEQMIVKHLRLKAHAGPPMDSRPHLAQMFGGLGFGARPNSPQSEPRHLASELATPNWFNGHVEPKNPRSIEYQVFHRDSVRTNIALLRGLGYRRIGQSHYFGFATDKDHPSHFLELARDFDAVEEPIFEDTESKEGDLLHMAREKRLFPMHHALMTLPDVQCLALLKAKVLEFPSHQSSWSATNDRRENLLHLAAIYMRVECVKWLMENIDVTCHLRTGLSEGLTPFEALGVMNEHSRTRQCACGCSGDKIDVTLQDRFIGHHDKPLQTLVALRGGSLSPEQVKWLKYGCTCDECVGGYLSPRMCVALLSEAELIHRTLSYGIDDGFIWVTMHDRLLKHITTNLLQKLRADKSLRQGFVNVFEHISACLTKKTPPTIETLQTHAQKSAPTKKFIKRGGSIDSALRLLFEVTRKADKWAGTGEGCERYGDKIDALKECRNDSEFGFAAGVSGVKSLGCKCIQHSGRP